MTLISAHGREKKHKYSKQKKKLVANGNVKWECKMVVLVEISSFEI